MKRKIYEPVTDFERATSYCPLYLAWRILDEARDYFRTSWVPSRKKHLIRPADTFSPSDAEKACQMGEGLADKLAHRAEAVFVRHPFWQRQFQSQRGREAILTSMRHWLAGELARERSALFRQLPESFKVGHPLPQKQTGGAAAPPYHKPKTVGLTCRSASISGTRSKASRPAHRFVHGCDLLAV
jgi:hypothetical protein